MAPVRAHVLEGFDDPAFGPERWGALLPAGDTDVVFLTWHWQRAWWESFGRGELLLVAAERDGRVVALAPLFSDAGMTFFVGSGGGALVYFDFIGDIGDPEVLDAILQTARARAPGFLGFRLYLVPEDSRTGQRLREAAGRLGMACHDEWEMPTVLLDLAARPEVGLAATRKKNVLRSERLLRREGRLEVSHLRDGEAILPHLGEFFEQHIARRAATPHPSLFLDPAQRAFYERLTRLAAHTGWLRFTRIDWNGRPIAFDFSFCYRGRYFGDTFSFALDLARYSPGQVLLRHLLLAAIAEGAISYNFGIGDEKYKNSFATCVSRVHTWGLYPPKGRGPP